MTEVSMMIWATVSEVRAYLDDEDVIPATEQDEQVQAVIDKAVRSLTTRVQRWPLLDDTTDRAEDADQRAHIVAAVAETVRARYERRALETAVGGAGVTRLIERGGSITAGKLSVSGGSRGSGGGAPVRDDRVPAEAIDALWAADLIGGSVTSC